MIDALGAYEKWLKADVLPRSQGDFRIGAENYRRKLLYDEMVDTPLDRLLQAGYDNLRLNQAEFKRVAAQLNPKRTAEQIARRVNFQPAAINQIKTAVVEACINAAEHSLSPDRKIYQRFVVEDDRLIITVASRGVVPTQFGSNGDAQDQGNGHARHSGFPPLTSRQTDRV